MLVSDDGTHLKTEVNNNMDWSSYDKINKKYEPLFTSEIISDLKTVIKGPYNKAPSCASISLRTCVCPLYHDDFISDFSSIVLVTQIQLQSCRDPIRASLVCSFFQQKIIRDNFTTVLEQKLMFLPRRPMIWLFSIHSVWEFHPIQLSREHQWKLLTGSLSP